MSRIRRVNKTLSISDSVSKLLLLPLILVFTSPNSSSLLSWRRGDTPPLIINHQNLCPVTLLAEVRCRGLLFCSVLFAALDIRCYFWYWRSCGLSHKRSTAIYINVFLTRLGKTSAKLSKPSGLLLPLAVTEEGQVWLFVTDELSFWIMSKKCTITTRLPKRPWMSQVQDKDIPLICMYWQTAAE